jgi:hypothetical protein
MEKDSLLYFNNPLEFIKYIHRFEVYKDWKIESGLMNDRGGKVANSDFFKEIRRLFELKGVFRKKVSVAEMVTWLDTFVHLERLFNIIIANYDNDYIKDIKIGFEYVVQMSKKSRIDCVIKYRNNYCLFEFTTVNKFTKLKASFDKKRIELIIYKDMMYNYISNKSKIICYPFVGLFEYHDGIRNNKFYINNKNNIAYAYDYLKAYILIK